MYFVKLGCYDNRDYGSYFYTDEELNLLKTRQLLKELRSVYVLDFDWDYYTEVENYRARIKAVLATREHIPNKQESKALRKLKKKRGN